MREAYSSCCCVFVLCFHCNPPDFYPSYRRVKAEKNGWGLASSGLYGPIRGVKIRWCKAFLRSFNGVVISEENGFMRKS